MKIRAEKKQSTRRNQERVSQRDFRTSPNHEIMQEPFPAARNSYRHGFDSIRFDSGIRKEHKRPQNTEDTKTAKMQGVGPKRNQNQPE